ncbi:MAG: CHAP domain-containing protein [Nitrospirota bacterium]
MKRTIQIIIILGSILFLLGKAAGLELEKGKKEYIGTYIYEYKERPELSMVSYHHIYILEIEKDGSYRLTQGTITSDPKWQHLCPPRVQSGKWKIITKEEVEREMRRIGPGELGEIEDTINFWPPLLVEPGPCVGIWDLIKKGNKLISSTSTVEFFPQTADIVFVKKPIEKIEKYRRQIESTSERKRETKPQIAGYTAKFNNLNYFLGSMRANVLKCPKESCNDDEEEAAKVVISHLLTKKSGEWLSGFIVWQVAKKLILSGLDELTQMAISLGETVIGEKIREIKDKFEKSHGADIKVFSLGWKDIGVLPIYLPYKERDGRHGKVDGEALMVFYSPHSISIKEIKDQVKSGGGRFAIYVPPIGLDEKLRQLPDEGIVRPFKLIKRGTVYELGEVKTYESWGETIKGPWVTFLEDEESVSTKVQITSSLRILGSSPYKVGDTITAEFSIKNIGTAPITFDVLTVGGRVNDTCPQDICPDFTWKENITLRPNEVYPYKGTLPLEASGNYHFFTAYRTKEGWNTAIPTAPDILNTIDIKVVPQQELSCPDGAEYPQVAHHKNDFDKVGLRGYCTWYAAERWLWDRNEIEMGDYVAFKPKTRVWDKKEELPSIRDANMWAEDAKKKGLYVDSENPIKGSIVVFGATSNNPGGHVAYVELVDKKEGTFTISQMNAGSRIDPKTLKTECFNKITMDALKIGATTYKGMKILGFIYPVTAAVAQPKPPAVAPAP